MKTISTCVITIFVFGILFLALPEKGYSGVPMVPSGPPCCQVGETNLICEGGEEAIETCEDEEFGLCAFATCTLLNNAVCVDNGDDTSSCIANTAPPTFIPGVKNVPTLSGWGFLSLAVVLGVIGVGAFLARKKKASA